MADYLVVKQTPTSSWTAVNISRGKTANTSGEDQAILESFDGAGTYAALRIDNTRILTASFEPKLSERVEEPVEEPVAEEPVEPAEEPVEDEPAGEPSAEDPVDEGEEPEATP